jgi:hypothetical protein
MQPVAEHANASVGADAFVRPVTLSAAKGRVPPARS